MKYFIVIAMFATIPFTGCSKEDKPTTPTIVSISDLLPKDNEISGWPRQAGTDVSWIATNTTELQEKINGGFELFANHGFVEAAMQKYSGTVNGQPKIELEIQVYNQNTAAQADAVFDDPNNVFANPITPTDPPSAKSQISKGLAYTMKFTKGKYYVLLTILSGDDKAQDVIEVFAKNVATKIP